MNDQQPEQNQNIPSSPAPDQGQAASAAESSSWFPKVMRFLLTRYPDPTLPPSGFLLLFSGALLLALTILQMSRFQWLGTPFILPDNYWNLSLGLALVLVAAGLYKLPSADGSADLPKRTAYPLLVLVFGVAAYLRLHLLGHPQGVYWDDESTGVLDILNVVDLRKFWVIFPNGQVEPLDRYAGALLWWLFPGMKALVVQRLAADLFSFAAIWLAYRLGREMTGKRLVGVLLAAFLAASKPMLLLTICSMNNVTVNFFSVALYLFFQVRLFKRPDLKHFLYWGAALALGLYSYTVIRPWVLYLVLVTLGWVLWQGRKERLRWRGYAVLLFLFVFLMFFLDKMLTVFHDNWFSNVWGGHFYLWAFWQVLFLALFAVGYRASSGQERLLRALGLGVLLAGILSYPMVLSDSTSKITCISLLPKSAGELFSLKFVTGMVERCVETARSFIVLDDDRPDMNYYGDPLFDYHAAVLLVIGLIGAVIRPSWWKTLLICSLGVSVISRLMTVDVESSKTMGVVIPFLLLAAMVLADWIEASWRSVGRQRWMGALLTVTLLAFWGWEVRGTFVRVYEKWWSMTAIDTRLNEQVGLDILDKRIYMVPTPGFRFFSTGAMGVLRDREPLYSFRDSNEIVLSPGEAPRDVVVLVSPFSTKVIDRLKMEFPMATWSTLWRVTRSPELEKLSYRVLIPADKIPHRPGKSFWIHEAGPNEWVRRVYPGYALARVGMILLEDASPKLNPMNPVVAKEGGDYSIWSQKQWDVPQDGDYRFSIESGDLLQVVIDGRVVLDSRPGPGKSAKADRTVHLKKGPHIVNILSLNKWEFPSVKVRNNALNVEEVLGS